MLARAASLADQGRPADAVEAYRRFGERWPGAWQSHDFNRKIGEQLLLAGEPAEAADRLMAAALADPEEWDTQALAGRAMLGAGAREQALQLFALELQGGNPGNDWALYHLGEAALERGDWVEAFRRFESVSDREGFAEGLESARALLDDEVIQPARRLAQGRPAA